ncbi:MAG TPA: hypothetical protein VFJ76_05125 [Solirubrobacterales bacterium]|nr:hypothetical protein [Solirubrobacterales bacterium]
MNTEKINSKTVDGLLEFCGFLAEKGLAGSKAMENWKGAVRNVFGAVEGEDYGSATLENLDLDEYLSRFETLTRGKYKPESLGAYGSRVRAAVEAYLAYLKDGTTPSPRPRRASSGGTSPQKRTTKSSAAPAKKQPQPPALGELIEFPFPLQSGAMATLRLPKRLNKEDADRLNLFLRSLQSEPQAQIPERTGEMAA